MAVVCLNYTVTWYTYQHAFKSTAFWTYFYIVLICLNLFYKRVKKMYTYLCFVLFW